VGQSDSDANDIVGALSFLFFFELKPDGVTLRKNIAETGVLHVALVKEHFIPIFRNDESKTLRHIEELHGSIIHSNSASPFQIRIKKPQREDPAGVEECKRS
jgi:hypothetical protein